MRDITGNGPSADTQAVRWDLAAMAELAAAVDAKADRLLSLRNEALGAAESARLDLEMRHTVITADWSRQAATALRRRRVLLAAADNGLAADLAAIRPTEPPGWKPELRARPLADIEAELGSALAAGREALAARLTLELATARRDHLLMAPTPDFGTIGQLQRLIDYLAYEMAKEVPGPAPDWGEATRAASRIADLLDESWLRDVTRRDLLAINRIVAGLGTAELDAVIGQLEDAQLYRWLREMDGVAGGNLSVEEEAELFRSIAATAGAATLFRIATSERGGKFREIAAAVFQTASPVVAIEFIEVCAAHAMDSENALAAAIGGLAELSADSRIVAYTALQRRGLAADLVAATHSFLEAQIVERDDPVIVEFLEGVIAGLTGAANAMWDLTGSLLVDSHHFRESWAGLAGTFALAARDPLAFIAVVLDLDTLQHNPARWTGTTVADLTSLGVGKLARMGRLGSAAKAVADWLRRLGTKAVDLGSLEVEAGHLVSTLERLQLAADALAIREAIEQVDEVSDLTARLELLPGEIPDLEITAALALLRQLAAAAESVVDDIAAALAA